MKGVPGSRSRVARHALPIVAVALAGLCALPAEAQLDPSRRDSPWRVAAAWRQRQGLPQDSVTSIHQSRDGYLWVGTKAGVARFDGVRFTIFDDRNREALRENEIFAITEGNDSSLWFGTFGGGVSRLLDGRFTIYTSKDGLGSDVVQKLATDREGAIWIGTDRGLSLFKGGVFKSYTEKDGLAGEGVRALYADPDGSLWVATPGGLQNFTKEGLQPPVTLPGPAVLVDAVCRDRQGALWIGTTDGLLRRDARGSLARYTIEHGLSSNRVRRLHEGTSGPLWIATDAGLDRSAEGDAPQSLFVTELRSTDITALHTDVEGNLWIGYRGHGLARLRQGLFRNYTVADGLPDVEVSSLLEDRSGALWLGTPAGLSAFRDGHIDTLGSEHGLPKGTPNALAQDRRGHLWVGMQAGLFRSTAPLSCTAEACAPRFMPVQGHPMLATDVRVIYEDRAGVVWIGSSVSGLARYEEGRLSTFTSADGLSDGAIRALVEDAEGALWIGTKTGGLNRLKDGRFTTYQEGLPSSSIQALHLDPDGKTLWIATRQGLSRLKDGLFKAITVADGLFANHVYGFVGDQRGNLWMGAGTGIFRVALQQLHDFADGKASSVVSIAYGREHGLGSATTAVGHQPVSGRSRDGRLWFATLGGLAVTDPRTLEINNLPPPVRIEEVRVGHRSFTVGAAIDAPAGPRDLVMSYTALTFVAPEKVRFRYRLEGFDREWVDAGSRREAFYTNLPPGSYRFRVLASNSDGVWNETGAAVSLRLAPYFFETAWFYAACAVFSLLGAGTTHLVRVRRMRTRERELSSQVEATVAEVKVLKGLLPICASCKRIRDEKGAWSPMESYIHAHSEAQFSHGTCPECSAAIQDLPEEASRTVARTEGH